MIAPGLAIPSGYQVIKPVGDVTKTHMPQKDGLHEIMEDESIINIAATMPASLDHAQEQTKIALKERRAETRRRNRKAHVEFTKEIKSSIANGKRPTIKRSRRHTTGDLKSRWHSCVKEVAYSVLDLRIKEWGGYSTHSKKMLHEEIKSRFSFDPPVTEKEINRYLAGHLRSQRGVWKLHWEKFGENNKHPGCPVEAWQTLVKWWPTPAAMDEATEMAARRAMVRWQPLAFGIM